MWCNGRHYRIKKLDETKKTCDFGISAVFEVTNVSLQAKDIQNCQKIDMMDIWKISLTVTLNHSK